jgi:hypothetical protein
VPQRKEARDGVGRADERGHCTRILEPCRFAKNVLGVDLSAAAAALLTIVTSPLRDDVTRSSVGLDEALRLAVPNASPLDLLVVHTVATLWCYEALGSLLGVRTQDETVRSGIKLLTMSSLGAYLLACHAGLVPDDWMLSHPWRSS